MSSEFHNNSSVGSVTPFVYENRKLWIAAFSFQFLFSIVENVLIIWIVYKDSRLKTTTNFLVANMACSDLLAAMFLFPRMIVATYSGEWLLDGVFGDILCKVWGFMSKVCFTVSLYSCILISVDRFYAVSNPLRKPFESKMKYIIAAIWIVPCLLDSPCFYFFIVQQKAAYANKRRCTTKTEGPGYYIFLFGLAAFNGTMTLSIVTMCYVLTVCKLYKHKVPGEQASSVIRSRQQQNKKILKMSLTIIGLLCFSWVGWFAFNILFSQRKLGRPSSILDMEYASHFVLFMSLVYNFFIYFIFNGIYRENINSLIHKSIRCWCQRTHIFDVRGKEEPSNTTQAAVSSPAIIRAEKMELRDIQISVHEHK